MSTRVKMLVCPKCEGSGAGWASMRGPMGGRADGMCPECRGVGEVTPTKWERLTGKTVPDYMRVP